MQIKSLNIIGCVVGILISVNGAFAQAQVPQIDLENPSEIDCYVLDSLLSESNYFTQEQNQDYIQTLADFLPEYDNYRLGLFYLDSLISIQQLKNETEQLADSYYQKSLLHDHLGEYPEALAASQEALKLYQSIKHQSGVALSYNDIGVIHYYREEYTKAEEYLKKAGDIFAELDDTSGMAIFYNNLANVYYEKGEGEAALDLYQQGYQLDLLQKNKEGECISLCNIGETYAFMGEFQEAEKTLLEALQIAEDLDDSWTFTVPLMSLGDLYQKTKEYHKAIHVLKRSLRLTSEIEALAEQSETCRLLYEIHKIQGDYSSALHYLELLRELEDELFNKDSERILQEMEMQYQVEDKQQQIELLNKESEIQELTYQQTLDEEANRQKILLIGIIGIALLLLFMIRGFIIKKKANLQLTEQNEVIQQKNTELHVAYEQIEEKSNEILDSIKYAKRIQSAILPAKQKINALLPDSFVLYLPKDVVAGDFYWLEQVDGKILFAVADCTGHGVPGAMVSVVCNNGLNRSVREHKLTDPGKILNKTREIVLEEFDKSEEKVNDGMDIALCCLDGNLLTFAGAHNALWIVRKDSNELEEIKGDKQPVGEFEKANDFTTHTVTVQKGDRIYLSSDGYADQFGGEKGKKLKTAYFKKLILSNANRSMNEQHTRLDDAFEEWRGSIEQIDDVCVLGVRI